MWLSKLKMLSITPLKGDSFNASYRRARGRGEMPRPRDASREAVHGKPGECPPLPRCEWRSGIVRPPGR